MEDILTASNPWKGQPCTRLDCLLCKTKLETGRNMKQDCSRRSLVYETKCAACERVEMEKIEAETEPGKERERRIKQIKQYKYIGETSRSVYERSREHVGDMEQLKPSSHLLKHIIDKHENDNPSEIKFELKIIKYTKSSWNRQILESVIIQQERKHYLLNSKAEYNRSAVPRLTAKMGEQQFKQWGKDEEKDKKKHEELESKIRMMRKDRNKWKAEEVRGRQRK